MEKWLQEYISISKDNANQQIGRYQGQAEAYGAILKRLDPSKFCQVCGYEYRTWGTDAEQQEAKAKHDSTHTT